MTTRRASASSSSLVQGLARQKTLVGTAGQGALPDGGRPIGIRARKVHFDPRMGVQGLKDRLRSTPGINIPHIA